MKQILSIFAGLLLATSALAFQPANTVKVIVPFPPGGGVDITFKKIEKYAQQQGINMIPEYQPGAEGIVGMNTAMTAPKDGNTLIVTTTEVAISKDSTAKRFNSLTDFEFNKIMSFVTEPGVKVSGPIVQSLYKEPLTTF